MILTMLPINCRTFPPSAPLPADTLFPSQCHGKRLVKIVDGHEDLSQCDGVWTENFSFKLGVKTADCAPICAWNESRFGVIHAGWRGTVNGIIEDFLALFKFELSSNLNQNLHIWVGPIHRRFEIQQDDCYAQIEAKFGDRFFTWQDDKIVFEFKDCLAFLLPENTHFDQRDTFFTPNLASWRRDKSFPNGQNSTVISPQNYE